MYGLKVIIKYNAEIRLKKTNILSKLSFYLTIFFYLNYVINITLYLKINDMLNFLLT